jgi:hypothetical protein
MEKKEEEKETEKQGVGEKIVEGRRGEKDT